MNYIFYLTFTARDENTGTKICGELSKELDVTNIQHHQLDITSQDSINKLCTYVQKTFEGLNILINNFHLVFCLWWELDML